MKSGRRVGLLARSLPILRSHPFGVKDVSTACPSQSIYQVHKRTVSVIAWGLNAWGCCGVKSMKPWLAAPEEVMEGLEVRHVVAGASHSLVVTQGNDVLSFGRGSSGELGNGKMEPMYIPSRIEHLVGKHSVQSVAVGPMSSYFLTQDGRLLASGKSIHPTSSMWHGSPKGIGSLAGEGRGSLLEMLDSPDMVMDEEDGEGVMRRGYDGASSLALHATHNGGSNGMNSGDGGISSSSGGISSNNGGLKSHARVDAYGNHIRDGRAKAAMTESSWASMHLIPLIDHRARSMELQSSKQLYSDSIRNLSEKYSAGKLWNDHMYEYHMNSLSLPTHVFGGAGLMGTIVQGHKKDMLSKKFSSIFSCGVTGRCIALTEEKIPVVLEPLKTALYGFEKSGVPASWMQASKPDASILQIIDTHGGAVKVGAGEHYYAVLCVSGKVLLWLNEKVTLSDGVTATPAHTRIVENGRVLLIINGLPEIKDISCAPDGFSCTDGSAVWSLSIPCPTQVESMGPARRILQFGDVGIRSIVSGGRSSAAITDEGKVWLWGSILSPKELAQASQLAENEGYGHWSYSSTSDRIPFGRDGAVVPAAPWPGLGGSLDPVEIPGLHKVSMLSLGTKHALAVVA